MRLLSNSTLFFAISVKLRMIADVPLGAFLSGGIDSSTVVAVMQAQSHRPIKTFSIGFHAAGYDESHYAKTIASHLCTDHTEFYLEPEHAVDLIPRLADWFDEPFADSSQIPTVLISQLTRKHVTVALSGDGGDEVFAGYNRYLWGERLLHITNSIPRPLRRHVAKVMHSISPDTWTRLFNFLPFARHAPQAADKLQKIANSTRQPRARRSVPQLRQSVATTRRNRMSGPRTHRTTLRSNA